MCLDETGIFSAQSHCTDTTQIKHTDNLSVQLSSEHHFGNFDRFCICHTQSRDKLCLLAKFFEESCDLWASAMHKNGTYTDVFHQCHITHDIFLQSLVDHSISAIFDDDRCSIKFLDIRQCIHEDFRLVFIGKHKRLLHYVWYSPLIFTYS